MADNDFLKRHNPEYVCLALISFGGVMALALLYQMAVKFFS